MLVVALGLAASACSAGATVASSGEPLAGTSGETAATTPLDPPAFADAVSDGSTFVVNVHVPDEGSIPGTDAEIPFDGIQARAAELPQDRSAPIAVYCRTGRMSAEAVTTLLSLGYSDLVELRGGMDAWVDDGRELLAPDN